MPVFAFRGGASGAWSIRKATALRGPGLPACSALDITPDEGTAPPGAAAWHLRGQISNLRYATRQEVTQLRAVQPELARPEARYAALIPLRKTTQWWELAQDERRTIFEEMSGHTRIGMDYLPAIARKLYHCRDLGEGFDFLTWFEFAPEHEPAFESLLASLRGSAEWEFVDREIDIRLVRAS